MAITSRELRARLEDAYMASAGLDQDPTSLRAYLRTAGQAIRGAISGGSVKSSTSDGKSVTFADYGAGSITQAELAEAYQTLIDRLDDAFLFLSNCCINGLDAFNTEFSFPSTSTTVVDQPVILDTTGRWAQLCLQFGVDPTLIIGTAVSDKAVFLWMMFHEVAAVEAYSDYTQLRVGQGAQFQ